MICNAAHYRCQSAMVIISRNLIRCRGYLVSRPQLASIATSSITCSPSSTNPKQPSDLKGRSSNAQRWLVRQFKDPYVIRSRIHNYRCRSAFKLIEIDDRFKILRPGSRVVDCGAAPGSWTQVAVERVNAGGEKKGQAIGKVMAVDKNSMAPIDGACILGYRDFTKPESQKDISACFDGRVDVVLSDMAPSATGHSELDHDRIIQLSMEAFLFAVQHLTKGGSFLTKIWDGHSREKLLNDMEKFFGLVTAVKPDASRDDSAELFLLGKSFKGIKHA